MLAISF